MSIAPGHSAALRHALEAKSQRAALPADAVLARAATPAQRRAALRAMVGRDTSSPDAAVSQFIDAANRQGLSLDNLWATFGPDGAARCTSLLTPGSGRTAMCFTSRPRSEPDAQELSWVIDAGVNDLAPGVLAQALVAPQETLHASAFRSAGFLTLATLAYLRRRPPRGLHRAKPATPDWPDGVTVDNWRPGDDPELLAALERSYIDTLDCPELCGLRDTRDVLESHRATGECHPSLWWIIRLHGQPAGAMLFNPFPDAGHTELVYLGVAPELRGKGLGTPLLRLGLDTVSATPFRTVTCAVDERNEPARRLYLRAGFESFARRVALVRLADPSA